MTPTETAPKNYWRERVAAAEAAEKAARDWADRQARDARLEDCLWRAGYTTVAILGIGLCYLKTIAAGGLAAIPFFIFLSLLTVGCVIGAWRMADR